METLAQGGGGGQIRRFHKCLCLTSYPTSDLPLPSPEAGLMRDAATGVVVPSAACPCACAAGSPTNKRFCPRRCQGMSTKCEALSTCTRSSLSPQVLRCLSTVSLWYPIAYVIISPGLCSSLAARSGPQISPLRILPRPRRASTPSLQTDLTLSQAGCLCVKDTCRGGESCSQQRGNQHAHAAAAETVRSTPGQPPGPGY